MNLCYSLEQLSKITNAKAFGNLEYKINNVNSLDAALSNEVSFLSNPRYKDLLHTTQAGIICIDSHTSPIEGKNFLISANPSQVFQIITDLIIPTSFSGFEDIHTSAVIHPTSQLENGVKVGPHVTIDQGVKIGKGTFIHANVYIGPNVTIGEDCVIHAGVVIREKTVLHNRIILQPGCVIGSCGFGYITDTKGYHKKIEQLGCVIIEDDVEIGSNTSIDRARFKQTLIKKGTKIDNLVQVGHNVILGEHNIIVAQTGISGSAKTGNYVILGGQAGVVGHVEIPDHTQIATRGGVTKNISKGGQYGGNPIQPFHEFNRHRVYIKNIEKYVQKISYLERKIQELEEKLISK